MSGTKHTPGPWRRDRVYSPEVNKESYSPYIVDSTGKNVAAAMMIPENEQEFIANARLIAAAPELLEALEQALSWIEIEGGRACATAVKARAVIVKGEGGDPMKTPEAIVTVYYDRNTDISYLFLDNGEAVTMFASMKQLSHEEADRTIDSIKQLHDITRIKCYSIPGIP